MNNDSNNVLVVMRQRESATTRFLERVSGREEWALKGFLDQARGEAQWLSRLRSEEPCRPNLSPGAADLLEQTLRIKARDALDDQVAEACGDLLEELNLLASEIVPRRILAPETPDAAREMVLHWALLLPAAAAADFRRRIERANAAYNHGGLALEVSGPWPPHSFCPHLERPSIFLAGPSCRSALNSRAARQRHPAEDVNNSVLSPARQEA